MFGWYDRVRIKSNGILGIIVDVTDVEEKYIIEIDDEHKTGDISKDLIPCKESDIEHIDK